MRVPLVNWDSVCSPKEEGGSGIKNSFVWNVAAVGKLVWWVYCSPDKLWVQWINQVYLKKQSWHDYHPKGDVSWSWKNVCRAKDKLILGFSHGSWSLDSKGYSVGSGYDFLRTRSQVVPWHQFIWHSWTVPKHRFLGWLLVRKALQVKEKLVALGVCQDDLCLLCGRATETHEHLFEDCEYSKRILMGMANLCKVSLPGGDILQGFWQQRRTQVQKSVLMCAFTACFYFIWKQRHTVRCEQVLVHPDIVCKQVHQVVKMRLRVFSNRILGMDRVWLQSTELCK
ncbi:uncharacterized protein LOC141631966 [Silene latifolia]|uniref:uncharacterized protein LOC141631966 n=1 Tax=Silene latifolia TaxID=37657 RepID=UPI003D77DA56